MEKSEEELKGLMMKVKEERGKVGLKVSIQQTKIGIQSCHFMVNNGETMETVTDFIFVVSKITADGDCSQKIKRLLLLERKPRQRIKKQTLLCYTVNHIVRAMDFSSSHVWM